MSTTRTQLYSYLKDQRETLDKELLRALQNEGKSFENFISALQASVEQRKIQPLDDFISSLTPGAQQAVKAVMALTGVMSDLGAKKQPTYETVHFAFLAGFDWGVSSRYRARQLIDTLKPLADSKKESIRRLREGHIKKYGTPEQRRHHTVLMRLEDQQLQATNPQLSTTERHKRVAIRLSKLGVSVSGKTVSRRLK